MGFSAPATVIDRRPFPIQRSQVATRSPAWAAGLRIAMLMGLCVVASVPALARQELPAPPPVAPAPPGAPTVTQPGRPAPWPEVSIEQALAQPITVPDRYDTWMLERLALIDLRLRPAPSPDDYQIAASALSLAGEGRASDANPWRRVVEAAFNAGDRDLVESATREVVRLDPADTVAQLRLITMRIGRLQTAEARLEAYRRLIGVESAASASAARAPAASLDASVRSRLALDAALLARETGDADLFARYLTLATELDSSNKEAAALALAFFQASVPDDRIGRFQLLTNLLMADPLDPNVHLTIAAELMGHGLFAQAGRFHNNSVAIVGADSMDSARMLDIRGLVLMWQIEGPARVVEVLEMRLSGLRHEAAVSAAAKRRQGIAIRDNERPENTRLDREYELLRLMAADAAGMRESTAASAADLRASAMEVVQFFQRPENMPTGDAGRDLARRITEMWTEALVVRAWASGDLEQLASDLQQTIGTMGDRVDLSEPIAWFQLMSGRPEEAIVFFQRTRATAYRSILGLAIANELLGQREAAADLYVEISRQDPGSIQSAWARSRLLFVTGRDLVRTPEADRVLRLADSVPIAIDRMIRDPGEFMRLQIAARQPRLGPLDLSTTSLVLANRGTLPLTVGANRPMVSRFLLSPEVRIGGEVVIGGVQPEVVDAEQRLRLAPGQQMELTLWPDVGFTGLFADTQTASRTGIAWRAIQGFRIVEKSYAVGPLCLADSTQEVYREPLLAARLSPEDLARAFADAPDSAMAPLCRAAFGVLTSASYGRRCTPEQSAVLAGVLAQRYTSVDVAHRRLMLSMLPPARLCAGFDAFGDTVRSSIASETDPSLLMLALLTWATTPDDPIVAACRASHDPRVSRAAEIQAARLASTTDGPTFSTAGPGLATLVGPSLPSLGVLGQ